MDFAVAGVAASVLVRELVELAEYVGLPSREAPIAAAVAGVLCGLAAGLLSGDTTLGAVVQQAIYGLMVGLGAVGVDAGIKRASGGSNAS